MRDQKELVGPEAERAMGRLTRRGLAVGAVAAAGGWLGWRWLGRAPREGLLPWPLRRTLAVNERASRALFSEAHLAPTFPADRARLPRVNGDVGLEKPVDVDRWSLRVEAPGRPARRVALSELRALPRVEQVTELCCVEGWSAVVRWSGFRLADFAARFALGGREGDPVDYVELATPDRSYYVGLDLPGALHPQTLLCDRMGGEPLTPDHGAPLRLVIPVKYGFKSIKRIGLIRFTDRRPRDYWADYGYDWYAGL